MRGLDAIVLPLPYTRAHFAHHDATRRHRMRTSENSPSTQSVEGPSPVLEEERL
jgi:hypothetical protein